MTAGLHTHRAGALRGVDLRRGGTGALTYGGASDLRWDADLRSDLRWAAYMRWGEQGHCAALTYGWEVLS